MKRFLVFLAAVAMMAVSCNKEQPTDNPVQNDTPKMRHIVLRATIDTPGTKADYYNKKIQFAKGDEIAISGTANENGSIVTRRYKLTATGVENETTVLFEGDVPEDAEMGKFAYFPYEIISEYSVLAGGFIDEENPDFTWPGDRYPIYGQTPDDVIFVPKAQVPMIGYINTSGSSKSATFYHLGAIAEVTLVNVPEGAYALQFENNTLFQKCDGNGDPINEFTTEIFTTYQAFMNSDGTPNYLMPCFVTGGGSNRCSVAIDGDGTYYIPLPAGTYTDFSISLIDSYSYSTYDQYYYKQRVSKPGTSVTLERGMHANFGTITYDADGIEPWFLRSDMAGWNDYNNSFRLIKTADDTYEISSYVYENNPWYNFSYYNGSQFVTYGVNEGVSGTLTTQNNATCKRGSDEVFTSTITKNGDNWELTDHGYGTDWDRCYDLSSTGITFVCSPTLNGENAINVDLTKANHNNNMLWYQEYFYIEKADNYYITFFVHEKDYRWYWYIGGNSASITDAKPYAQASDIEADYFMDNLDSSLMSLQLTPGYYNIYLDVRTLNFMFVRTIKPLPIVN